MSAPHVGAAAPASCPALFPASLELRCGPVTAVDLALYAAASGDLNPLHLDDAVARSAGFAQPVVHGMLSMAYVGRMFTQAFGACALVSLNTRFVGAALRGDTLVLRAQWSEDQGESAGAHPGASGATSALYQLSGRTETGIEIVSGSARVRWPAPGMTPATSPGAPA